MTKTNKIFNYWAAASSVLLILTLLWLTVSAPFVCATQQELAKMEKKSSVNNPNTSNEEEASGAFGNTTEEKAPSNSSLTEEYLHDNHNADHFFAIVSRTHNFENSGTYLAFHGELLVPPPNHA